MLPTVPRIAVVVVCEDDDHREQLCRNLTEDRFTGTARGRRQQALRLCRYDAPDAMLLDLALPDASGLDVLREIRAAEGPAPLFRASLPIMVVSGHGADPESVYAGSPRAPTTTSSSRSSTRSCSPGCACSSCGRDGSRGPARIGELKLDLATRTVEVAGQPVVLANKEFELLRVLAREPQRVFTKDELLREIWGYSAGSRTRTLDSHASRLRRKLDSGGRFVVNCWGVGYRLVEGGMQ